MKSEMDKSTEKTLIGLNDLIGCSLGAEERWNKDVIENRSSEDHPLRDDRLFAMAKENGFSNERNEVGREDARIGRFCSAFFRGRAMQKHSCVAYLERMHDKGNDAGHAARVRTVHFRDDCLHRRSLLRENNIPEDEIFSQDERELVSHFKLFGSDLGREDERNGCIARKDVLAGCVRNGTYGGFLRGRGKRRREVVLGDGDQAARIIWNNGDGLERGR